jgi:glutathione S-transferase
MLKLFAWPTPHGITTTIILEELKLKYDLTLIDPMKPQDQNAEYAKYSGFGKLPLLVDEEEGGKKQQSPVLLWDSNAILLYLAEKHNQLLPKKLTEKAGVYQWLFHQASLITPTLGHVFYYRKIAKEKNQEAIDRYTNESIRLLQGLELHLKNHAFLAGDYSIADISTFPWIKSLDQLEFNIEKLENLSRWRDNIVNRPAVEKAVLVFKDQAAA